jgi:tRNA pseudouridine38-40 synthase
MRRICLDISYDGTDYSGWQVQQNARTVQGELERALEIIHKQPVRLHGSGRTDSGVHALHQFAHMDSVIDSMPANRFTAALNRLLPEDVTIRSSWEVPHDFHARYSAVERTYEYVIRSYDTLTPMNCRFCTPVVTLPDMQRLNAFASRIVGVHDFSSFAAAGDPNETKIRRIIDAVWYVREEALVFRITGNAFLWRMVRSIVGTMLDLSVQNCSSDRFFSILHAKDRFLAGTTAPARGLTLMGVRYED